MGTKTFSPELLLKISANDQIALDSLNQSLNNGLPKELTTYSSFRAITD